MKKFTDRELQEIIDSYNGLGLIIGSVNENQVRQAFNQRVKDNHPDSTTDPVLKRLFEEKLKEYIHYRDICLKTHNFPNLNDQINSYKVRKKITSTISAYYKKSRPLRYAFAIMLFFGMMYHFLGIHTLLFKSGTTISRTGSTSNTAKNNSIPEESPGISSTSEEVASSSSYPAPKLSEEELFSEGQTYVVKYAYNKMGVTIKERPSFDSKTISVLPYGTKFTAKMTKKVTKLDNTYGAHWYYLEEVDGFTLGEYLVGKEPDESAPLELIEDPTREIYTTNLKIKYGSHIIALEKNKAYYYIGKNDKEPSQIGSYIVDKNIIHISLEHEEITLKYKSINEYEIVSVKY